MKRLTFPSYSQLFCLALFSLAAYLLTAVTNKDFLLWADETALFLPTRLFFLDKMQTPGGLLSYLGLFLNQFFVYPRLGSILFILLQTGIVFLLVKTFRIPKALFPLAFIPGICLLTSLTDIGYILYSLRSPGYLFSNSLGVVAVLSALIGYQHIKQTWQQALAIALFVLLTYPLFGFYTLFAVLLAVIYTVIARNEATKNKWIIIATAMLFGSFIPYLYYTYHYAFLKGVYIYTAGLPKFYWGIEFELWLPFLLLFFCLISFLFLKELKNLKGLKLLKNLSWTIFVIFLIASCFYHRPDANFKSELAMNHAVEANDWEQVIRLGDQAKGHPTRLMVMDYNLALFKLGKAGDKMFTRNQTSTVASTKRPDLVTMQMGAKPVYFQYGKINYCYRWCVEDMVEYGMSAQGLKYMVRCAIGIGDFALAQKYNNVLKKTLFHKSYAEEYQQYIENPKSFLEIPEIKAIKPLLAYDNLLDGDGGLLELYVLNSFAYMQGGPPEIVELSLQCNLVLKNIDRFWPRFFLYARTHDRIPVHYQEAALLYSFLEGKPDISKLVEAKFDKAIVTRFEQFIALSTLNADKPDEYNKVAFKPQFGDTFYYYYFFITDLKTN
ncbi:hypothetical protein FACS189421_09850 [Bacteroidia bacterium]|nr:hypothetical protein FACS189421_09850 [Bacteroidia bacterium]